MTNFDSQLAKAYYKQVFKGHQPMKLSEFIPNLADRTYNLMTETDTITRLRERFGITDKFAGGIYMFWWLGSAKELNDLESLHKIKGKRESADENIRNAEEQGYVVEDGHIIHNGEYHFNEVHIDSQTKAICPLYVGKTSWLQNRIRLHLQWPGLKAACQQPDPITHLTPIEKAHHDRRIFKHTTACQFRAGFEFLFRDQLSKGGYNSKEERQENKEKREQSLRKRHQFLTDNIGITVATTPTDDGDGFEDRFFTEDLLIGVFRAPFNLDSER